ncbi:SAM-dependent DNA methyltransferase [Tsukamurella tyrosinosolvens]|uniref:HsdM family class I SAM-dependent methyltransferase n=1 Tax=Tsukamurella tyrosinosolvens TaxID=57704 RepID=UPI001CE1ACF2|nr:N-6 DNA methylase [Tsukamurella tyrosinosolvens]MCA4995229.1 SAM-dependent DNA methyltransferase [Tsukamurella tyrosinosolvens]
MSKNERDSEEIVRQHLKDHAVDGQIVEEQISSNPGIKRSLSKASKSGSGPGKPEFIITFPADQPNLVIVFECKADIRKHESRNRDKPAEYAVDGVLVYSRALALRWDVIAVAVSGTDSENLKVSTFKQPKGSAQPLPLCGQRGEVDQLQPVGTYLELFAFDPEVRARTEAELLAFSRVLHNYMRDYAKLSEAEKPLVVSAILLALRDETFHTNWRTYKPRYLARELFNAIERVAVESDINERKRETMLAPYEFVKTHPELSRATGNSGAPLRRLISDIDEHLKPFVETYHDVDVIGQFYGEFLRYTGGDKKGLGIVLTPRHLTDLCVKMVDLGTNDIVVDTCAGTGGFLISALAEFDERVGYNEDARLQVREHQLIGVEQLPHMFALAASNMILRGDGKANLYRDSCFDPDQIKKLKNGVPGKHGRPTVGLINPPFSQRGEGQHELEFAEVLLDVLAPGGTAVVVTPMSCALEAHPVRERILQKHTLVAQMSLPNDIFSPVGTVPCLMVFKAHHPHTHASQPTWFGYWKDDGFVKTKNKGRVDLNGKWAGIRAEWLSNYSGRKVVPGHSALQVVTSEDDWSAEAYLQTDYTKVTSRDFDAALKKYLVFTLMNDGADDMDDDSDEDDTE